ncbi:MAG: hypothetical protein AAGA76_15605 [Pseudomonadota bacterium]
MPNPPDHRLTLRFKPDEYAVLKAKAGDKPLSTFVRATVLETATIRRKKAKAAPIIDHKAIAQILALLGQHELVQAFKDSGRDTDSGVKPADDETRLLLKECRDLLAAIHNLLMRALRVAKR